MDGLERLDDWLSSGPSPTGEYPIGDIAGKYDVLPMDAATLDRLIAHAQVSAIEDGTSWFAHVPGMDGVWGKGPTRELALDDLEAAIPPWVSFHVWKGMPLPNVAGIDLERAVHA